MNDDNNAFERFVADRFSEVERSTSPAGAIDLILVQARRTRPMPRWLALLKEPPMRLSSRVAVGSPMVRITAVFVALITILTLTAGAAVVGASLLQNPSSACPSGAGESVPGPAMAQPREPSVGVTLSDGRVLVAGGEYPAEQFIPTAELWEPGADAFREAGTLAAFPHTALALGDDRVLVIPNRDGRAQVWDPASHELTLTGALAPPRGDMAATALQDDRVLVVGGDLTGAPTESPLATATLWDPASGEFRDAGALVHPRKNHTATLLDDGRVLVVGGNDGSQVIGAAELWDPASESFAEGSTMSAPRIGHKAVALPDGRVLIVGGTDDSGPVAEVELWDPATGAFTPAGTLLTPRAASHTLTLLADGRVLVVGGYQDEFAGKALDSAEVWDPVTLTFSPAGTLLAPRGMHVAAAQPDCSVLIIGSNPSVDPTVERWVPHAAGE